MSFDPREYLRHIIAEADYLRQQTAAISKEEFLKSETLRRAVWRRLGNPAIAAVYTAS